MLPSPSSISMFHIRSCKLSDAHEGAFAIMVLPSQPVAQHRRLPKLKPVVDKHSSDALRVDDRHHHLYGLGCKQSAGRHKGIPAPEGTSCGNDLATAGRCRPRPILSQIPILLR